MRGWILSFIPLFAVGCGPSDASEAETAKDVSWLSEHAKAGEPDAMASLCKIAQESAEGASAALAEARTGKDPNQHLETLACMVDLGLRGDAAFATITRELMKAPALPVRTAALNAVAAAAAEASKRASVAPFIPDLQARLRDEEDGIWRRALNALYNQGPAGRSALAAALQVPELTRRRELTRRVADFEETPAELGPLALAWIVQGESEVFDKLENIVVQSGMTIATARGDLLAMFASNVDAKVDSALHLSRSFSDEGRCDADVVRAVLMTAGRTTDQAPEPPPDQPLPEHPPVGPFAWCEEPCLVQVRSVAYKCRQIADPVLRSLAAAPATEGPSAQPREIARATLGL